MKALTTRKARDSLEKKWRKVDHGRREASLAWSLNEVFGHLFWIGGAFKVSSQATLSNLLLICMHSHSGFRGHMSDDGTLGGQGALSSGTSAKRF